MSITWGSENQSISSGQKKLADIYSQRIKPQYLKTIELNDNVLPLLNIMERMKKIGTVGDSSFFHFEEDEVPQLVQISGVNGTGVTDILLTSSTNIKNIKVGQILYVTRTNEQMAVTAVNYSTYYITVIRGHGGTTATATVANDYVQILAMSDTDGNTAPSGVGVEPKKKTNYLQIAKVSIELSGRMENADTYQGGNKAREWAKQLYNLQQQMEKSFLFGQLNDGTTGPVTTGGLKYWISSNLVDQNSVALTESALELFLQKVYRFNQEKKLLFLCGENMMAWINKFGKDRLMYTESNFVPGVKVTRFKSVWGDLELIPHGMLTTNYEPGLYWTGMCFAINPDNIGKISYKNREMMYEKAKQTPDLDGTKDYALADFGCYLGAERKFGLMTNIPNPLS